LNEHRRLQDAGASGSAAGTGEGRCILVSLPSWLS
jgi:hypothetical protein